MAGKPKQNMVPHLCKCIYVDPATKTHAQSARAEATADESRTPSLSHSASWSHMLQPPASAWSGGPDSTPPRPVPKTAIPLKLLFLFPTDRNSPSTGTDYFWQGGIKNLDKEMEAYEILCANQELQEGAGVIDTAEGVPTAGESIVDLNFVYSLN